ncbi:hypothetical protein JTM08_36065, partial [Pseudomonas aeruginosa]|nr:hypothetical protein [Pseudomonas aeruginosa]
ILLIANVSQSYFNQRLAAAQLQVANDTLQNYQQSYAFVEKQLLTGSTTVLALAQALERLALLWPDGKLTLPRVEQAVNDAAHFTPYHWVDALLAGKSKRVLHVL